MPADKLVLLAPRIETKFSELAKSEGRRTGGYSAYIDLGTTEAELAVRLYAGGVHNGINKLQFNNTAGLGLTGVRNIAEEIIGIRDVGRISRLDWCIDVLGYSVADIAFYCRVPRAQNCSFHRSRSGLTVYLRQSKQHVILIYDKIAHHRYTGNPLQQYYGPDDRLTRIEVQLRGRGLPFRRFKDIERYAELDLLSDLTFWKVGRKASDLNSIDELAAEGLLRKADEVGLQVTSKMYSAQEWSYIQRKFLTPVTQTKWPDLNALMRKSIRDWLDDRIRFPRLLKRQ